MPVIFHNNRSLSKRHCHASTDNISWRDVIRKMIIGLYESVTAVHTTLIR
jgi:hypothetical protein